MTLSRKPARAAPNGSIERALSEADFNLLADGARAEAPGARISKVRASHHRLARILSDGASLIEASAMTGYTPSHISILKADPTFAELLQGYIDQKIEIFNQANEKMLMTLDTTLDELQHRVENKPETIDNHTLVEIVKAVADRTGHGTSTRVDVKFDIADRLDAARRRAGLLRGEEPRTIEHEPPKLRLVEAPTE